MKTVTFGGKNNTPSKPATKKPAKSKKKPVVKLDEARKLLAKAESPVYFKKRMNSLRRMINSDDPLSEKSSVEIVKAMLGATLEGVRTAEKTFREKPNHFNAFALNNLMTQANALQKELRLLQTQEQQLAQVVDDAVMTGLKRLVYQLSQNIILLNAAIDQTLSPKKAKKLKARTDKAADDMGQVAQDIAVQIREQIISNA